jgi:hypothetical protein
MADYDKVIEIDPKNPNAYACAAASAWRAVSWRRPSPT